RRADGRVAGDVVVVGGGEPREGGAGHVDRAELGLQFGRELGLLAAGSAAGVGGARRPVVVTATGPEQAERRGQCEGEDRPATWWGVHGSSSAGRTDANETVLATTTNVKPASAMKARVTKPNSRNQMSAQA